MKKLLFLLTVIGTISLFASSDEIEQINASEKNFFEEQNKIEIFDVWQKFAKSLAQITTTVKAGGPGGVDSVYTQARYDIFEEMQYVFSEDSYSVDENWFLQCEKALNEIQKVSHLLPPIGTEPTLTKDLQEAALATTKLVEAVAEQYGADNPEAARIQNRIYQLFTKNLLNNMSFIVENYSEEDLNF